MPDNTFADWKEKYEKAIWKSEADIAIVGMATTATTIEELECVCKKANHNSRLFKEALQKMVIEAEKSKSCDDWNKIFWVSTYASDIEKRATSELINFDNVIEYPSITNPFDKN